MSDLFFFKDDDLIRKARVQPWKAPKAAKYQDEFSFAYSTISSEECPESELGALVGTTAKYDVECYSNFFYVAFLLENGKVVTFTQDEYNKMNLAKLEWMLFNFCIVGYNSKRYDILMLMLALKGVTCAALHKASCEIIQGAGIQAYKFEKKYKLKPAPKNHIDLIEVAPLIGSLKLYAGRLHTKRMQDLPFDPMKPVSEAGKAELKVYCGNDLVNTNLLWKELESQMILRLQMSKQYQVDLRSKSDAQIAEAVISSELNKLNGTACRRPEIDEGTCYRYNVPSFVGFRTPILREMLEIVRNTKFIVDGQGYTFPEHFPNDKLSKTPIPIGNCVYAMGIGGLHSTEKTIAHIADEETLLIDRDVVSYYPSIILNQKLYPKHLGLAFLSVYKKLVVTRIEAKNRIPLLKKEIAELERQLNETS